MYIVKFEQYNNITQKSKIKTIGKGSSRKDCWKIVSDYIANKLNINPYYYSTYEKDGTTHIDYGSHYNFFLIEKEQ